MCLTLAQLGYRPVLVGRQRQASLPLAPRPYPTHRLRVWPESGPGFYAALNVRLFTWLLGQKLDAITANDLDTLLACYLASRLKGIPLIYDSHEYFTGAPELAARPRVRAVWHALERWLLPRTRHRITVNPAVAERYAQEYGLHFHVIYNWPLRQPPTTAPKPSPPVVLYQGMLLKGRGLETLLRAWPLLTTPAQLWLVGDGYHRPALEALVRTLPPHANPIRFVGYVPLDALARYTAQAAVGLSLEDPHSANNLLSTPNKVFDYLQAGVPVVATDRPALRPLTDQYTIGRILPELTEAAIAQALTELLPPSPAHAELAPHLAAAAEAFTWEHQTPALSQVYRAALGTP